MSAPRDPRRSGAPAPQGPAAAVDPAAVDPAAVDPAAVDPAAVDPASVDSGPVAFGPADAADPLWTPGRNGDADLARLEHLLRRYRHVARASPVWPQARPTARRGLRPIGALAAAALVVASLLGGWFAWRLQWGDGAAWQVSRTHADRERLAPGARLATGPDEHAQLDVARIGSLQLSPHTSVRLLETRSGRHRVVLESGHVHARIWAPPGWFGMRVQDAEVIDLGCVFDLWTDADGAGRAVVHSGWIMHARIGQETLVPVGHALHFDGAWASIPVRVDADAGWAQRVQDLDRTMGAGGADAQAQRWIAQRATPADLFTLLSLMTRHPGLASGPIYPRLASLLGAPLDDQRHRTAWASGSAHAINDWWDRVARPPKQWWRDWQDAL